MYSQCLLICQLLVLSRMDCSSGAALFLNYNGQVTFDYYDRNMTRFPSLSFSFILFVILEDIPS